MARATMYFPPDFLWGTATSSHQVEGNNQNNDWWAWEQEGGHILDGGRSGNACDWWENAEQDVERMAEMGANAHRLSIEWSRVEPEPSVFDAEALNRYREIIQAMRRRNIEPMVGLHHFTNPLWLVEKGDFDKDLIVDYFQRYATRVVEALGDLVPKWLTFNEPMVYFLFRYVQDLFPAPNHTGWRSGFRALGNMLRCHAAAYETIKSVQATAMVGLAKHYRVIEAWPESNRLNRRWANRVSRFFNDLWMDSLTTGKKRWPLGRGSIRGLAGSFDFTAINYYSRSLVRFPPRPGRLYESKAPRGAVLADDDYFELYPQGLFKAIKATLRFGKPIYVTENGLPDANDKHRSEFILTHLREVWRAISFNYPVMGYYHWTLVDNFEWDRGWRQRFGLIELNPETQERAWRPSGRLYAEICRTNCISSDMAERYAPDLLESMFPGKSPDAQPQATGNQPEAA